MIHCFIVYRCRILLILRIYSANCVDIIFASKQIIIRMREQRCGLARCTKCALYIFENKEKDEKPAFKLQNDLEAGCYKLYDDCLMYDWYWAQQKYSKIYIRFECNLECGMKLFVCLFLYDKDAGKASTYEAHIDNSSYVYYITM